MIIVWLVVCPHSNPSLRLSERKKTPMHCFNTMHITISRIMKTAYMVKKKKKTISTQHPRTTLSYLFTVKKLLLYTVQ